nr:charged multivesicular body protein 7 [Onthophagus taurus]
MTDLLPEDKLPASWNDEARLNVLFAPFRSRSVNPKDWDTKMHFWKNLTFIYCTHHEKYSFTLPELTKIFTKNGRPPACLNVVVDDMVKSSEIKPIGDFLTKPSETWGSWAADTFIKKPVVWSFKKLKDSVMTPDTNVRYIHVLAIEKNATELCNNLPEDFDMKVIDLKEVVKVLEIKNDENLHFIIHYLNCEKKISLKEVHSGREIVTLVKFCNKNFCDITDGDVDLYTLEVSEKTLLETVDKLEEQANKLIKEVKNYLLAGKKQLAKISLRKKHELERTIEKRVHALHNIQILISRLKDADTDGQVLASYQKALAGLRRTFNEKGLNEDAVSDTMLDLEEMMDVQKDIQEAMVFKTTDIANDRELEEELEDLLAEETAEKKDEGLELKDSKTSKEEVDDLEKELKDLELTSPPSESPGFSGVKKSDLNEKSEGKNVFLQTQE